MRYSTVELIYGQNIRLPGQFFVQKEDLEVDSDFICKLKEHIHALLPTTASSHGKRPTFFFKDLNTCSYVFLRVDAVETSLHPPCTGPYSILKRGIKTFALLVNGKNTFSIDRLKPYHLVAYSVAPSKVLGSTPTDNADHRTVPAGSDTETRTPAFRAATTIKTMYGKSTASSYATAATSIPRTRAGHRVHFPKRYKTDENYNEDSDEDSDEESDGFDDNSDEDSDDDSDEDSDDESDDESDGFDDDSTSGEWLNETVVQQNKG
ncbi:hypothetical protein AVEN_241405-1 [Araneus ventricosus]|uniref:Uncharacterized protein n=1 Tax=Araneus ventricosus TaxID=182803 RepID=A0A4Y2M8R2_ARAVE|nr:hypothetical protein AVEN_241405-1 [Araneus ventricosus]